MPRNGSGTYALPNAAVATGGVIDSSWMNTTLDDIASALTASVAVDGQSPISADINMASKKHLAVAAAAARDQYAQMGQVQDSTPQWLSSVTGTNTIAASLTTPTLATYTAGQTFRFASAGANTGAVTININALGAKAIQSHGAALTGSEISASSVYEIVFDGTQFQLINPKAPVEMPSGMISTFANTSAPSGWLSCDGSAVSRTTYASLFSAISTTYGSGDGSTTFTLPDLRGYFVRGYGTNGDGAASGAFATKVADTYLNHAHTAGVTDPGHAHSYTYPAATAVRTDALQTAYGQLNTGATTGSNTTGISVTVNTSSTGGTETKPKNIALLYCIKT